MDNGEYVNVLKDKLKELEAEISNLRNDVAEIFLVIEEKQKQSNHIIELLTAEGYKTSDEELLNTGQLHITDMAERYLREQDKNKTIHYKELANKLQAKGHAITGKDPAANLLSQINRDDRFVRVSPGTYGLREWGLTEQKPRKAKRKRQKRK